MRTDRGWRAQNEESRNWSGFSMIGTTELESMTVGNIDDVAACGAMDLLFVQNIELLLDVAQSEQEDNGEDNEQFKRQDKKRNAEREYDERGQ